MPKNYNTKQKQEIEAIINLKKGEHFTCEEICEEIRGKGKAVGLTTVYRHLDKMVKDGALYKYSKEAGESACYQSAEASGHFHLKCTVCGKLMHLSCKSLESIGAHVKEEHQFKIDPSKTVFFGVCGECGK